MTRCSEALSSIVLSTNPQAKQDLNAVTQLAGSVGGALAGMANKFMSDLRAPAPTRY